MIPDMPQCYSDSAEPILIPANNVNNLQWCDWFSVATVQLQEAQLLYVDYAILFIIKKIC